MADMYIIRVQGHIDGSWAQWFVSPLSITHDVDGTSFLVGIVIDQAALYGILAKIHDLGLTLLSLYRKEDLKEIPFHDRRSLHRYSLRPGLKEQHLRKKYS